MTLEDGETVQWEPEYMAPEVVSWTPVFEAANPGTKVTMPKKKKGEKAEVPSNDPAKVEEPTTPAKTKPAKTKEKDDSGIDPPDSELSDVSAVEATVPPDGKYTFRLTKLTVDPDDGEEDQSPMGPPTRVFVTGGFYPKVSLPRDYGNWIKNPEVAARKNDAAKSPEDWERPAAAGVTLLDDEPGAPTWNDQTGSVTDQDLERTTPVACSDKPTLSLRRVIEVSDYASGAVVWILRQNLSNGTFTETVLEKVITAGEHDIVKVVAAAAVPKKDVAWNALVSTYQLIVRAVGGTTTVPAPDPGPRHFKVKLKHAGGHKGRHHPHKRRRKRHHGRGGDHDTPPVVSPPTEEPALPYPTFGYVTVVENPPDAQRAVLVDSPRSYVPGNVVEYYGPEGMPVNSTFFMSGMKQPVKPGEFWTASVHFFWRGVDQAATPLKAVLKDRQGRVIADLGGFEGVTNVLGDSEDQPDADANGYVRRKLVVAVPTGSQAAYVELVSGGVGDGLWRIMGHQRERGQTMTAWTDDHSPSGSLVSTFELKIAGVPTGVLSDLAKVKRFAEIGAEITHHESGTTSHLTEARVMPTPAGWSAWTTDPAELPIDGLNEDALIQVKTTMFTTNVDYTPELHSHFADFERDLLPGFGVLCRADGTEFDGSATVYGFPPVAPEKPILEETYADNTGGFGVMGKTRNWARGFGVEFYLDPTAEEFMAAQGEEESEEKDQLEDDASVFVAEWRGRRYRLRVLSAAVLPENREAHVPIPGQENDGRWNLRAEAIEAEVMGVRRF